MLSFASDKYDEDQARIAARRARSSARAERLQDSKLRAIGVDRSALEAQIAERDAQRARDVLEREADAAQVQLMVAAANSIERERALAQSAMNARYSANWDNSVAARPAYAPYDPRADVCPREEDRGISSAQIFAGENRDGKAKSKQAQDSLSSWLDQQIATKTAQAAAEKSADAATDQRLLAGVAIASTAAGEDAAARAMDAVLLRETNRQMAAQYAASQAAAAAASSGLSAAHVRSVLTDPLLLEPMRGANVPRESFKGFPKATEYARATYNADVASDHRAASAAEQRFAAETAQRQSAMLAQLEDDARAARQSEYSTNVQGAATWGEQSAAAAAWRAADRTKRFEPIDQTPFYGSFGTSDR
jgi:hypothetical protein